MWNGNVSATEHELLRFLFVNVSPVWSTGLMMPVRVITPPCIGATLPTSQVKETEPVGVTGRLLSKPTSISSAGTTSVMTTPVTVVPPALPKVSVKVRGAAHIFHRDGNILPPRQICKARIATRSINGAHIGVQVGRLAARLQPPSTQE